MSNANAKNSSSSPFETIRPVIVLVAICIVASALLGYVHAVTAPIAEANAAKKAQETYAMLVPEAKEFVEVECGVEGCVAALEARDAAGDVVAYVIVAQSKGYGGQVPIAVAFGRKGGVKSITAMANDETPGLGTKIAEEAYISQYVGKEAAQLEADGIDLISGATISSKAALSAFNIAVKAYEEVS